jgi:hypothetical protein
MSNAKIPAYRQAPNRAGTGQAGKVKINVKFQMQEGLTHTNVRDLVAQKSAYPAVRIRYDSLRFGIYPFGFHLNFELWHLKLI